uniref:Uncharacterized protein n=1 Tax=Romanomermis culicivorax TaxID=13658 RepID=A0A915I9D8_ROMCU
MRTVFFVLSFFRSCPSSCARNYEHDLYRDIIENYDSRERPVLTYADAVEVFFGISLQQLVDVDEKNQVVIMNMWLQIEWTDQNIAWNAATYGNISTICLPSKLIWKPDVLLYNSVDKKFDTNYASNVVVAKNGYVLWVPPAIVRISCNMDVRWFPFDEQNCYFKFGSWSYTQSRLKLEKHKDKLFDISEYITNVEWDVIENYVTIKEVNYSKDKPDPYRSLIFNFKIRRRILYYVFNFILPSFFIFLMTLFGFILPVECCEKITLEITILVAICVFLIMLMNVMPTTSESVPLIGIFFSFHFFLVSGSVLFQVVVLNFYYRNPAIQRPMSSVTKFLLLKFFPRLLGIKRPGHENETTEKCSEFSQVRPSFNENFSRRLNDKRIYRCLADLTRKDDGDDFLRDRKLFIVDGGMYFNAFFLTLRQIYVDLKSITDRMKKQDDIDDQKNDWKFAATR